ELSPAELFFTAGFASDQLESAPASRSEQMLLRESEREIVQAVFARVAALSDSKEAAATLLRNAERQGNSLVPLYYQRLASFVRQRDQFPTLREFLPYLVRGLSEENLRRAGGTAIPASMSSCSAPNSALVATAAS